MRELDRLIAELERDEEIRRAETLIRLNEELLAENSMSKWERLKRRLLDFVASLCFCFDVDWDKDFDDDEWCLERKENR
jgi:hypothetical protein